MDKLKLFGQNKKEIHTLINTVQIFSKDIEIQFRISRRVTLIIKRGNISRSEGILLPND